MREPPGRRSLIALLTFPIAVLLFANAFVFDVDAFWMAMTTGVLALAGIAALVRGFGLYRERAEPVDLAIGAGSAALLYGIFWAGDRLIGLLLPFTEDEVRSVYGLGEQLPLLAIAVLLVFVIAPGEELYWRGLIQWAARQRWGPEAGVLAGTLLYAGAHVVSGSLVVVLAAFAGGVVWSLLYAIRGRLLPVIVSHVLFDLLVFVLLPLRPM